MRLPLKEKIHITNIYGKPNPMYASGKHDGVDLVTRGEDDTVYSCTSGKVIRSGWNDSWGNYVVVQIPDGRALVYAHLSKRLVIVNNTVSEGARLGIMGNTGNSFGKHLHLELQRNYYKCGDVDDICKFLGIDNVLGEVKVGEELIVKNITVEKNGELIEVSSIQHEGNNYIKMRDIEKIAPVTIGYNASTNRPIVEDATGISCYDYAYKQTSGSKVIATHMMRVWEFSPEMLHLEVIKGNLNNVKHHDYMINSGYFWKDTSGVPYSLSCLVEDGKVLGNNQHSKARGCFIVRTDNSVEIKQVANINNEKNVKFAVGGMTVCPEVLKAQEGFQDDVTRETSRVIMGWNPKKGKVMVVGYSKMSAVRARDVLKELGCSSGITLDAGGSATMLEKGKYHVKSDGRNQFACIFLK